MSPTTLYREGTDLDALLAELDDQYPRRVRVVEVSHPREGGVLGFFTKQRVGVHYRLVAPSESSSSVTPLPVGYDAAAAPAPVSADARLSGASTSQQPRTDTGDSARLNRVEDVDAADLAGGLASEAAPSGGEPSFADILAQLALRAPGPTATATRTATPSVTATATATAEAPSQGIDGSRRPMRFGPSAEALAQARRRSADQPASAQSIPAQSNPAPVDTTATVQAPVPAPAPAAVSSPTAATPAFTSLPHLSSADAARPKLGEGFTPLDSASPGRPVLHHADSAGSPEATIPAAFRPPSPDDSSGTGALNWPLASRSEEAPTCGTTPPAIPTQRDPRFAPDDTAPANKDQPVTAPADATDTAAATTPQQPEPAPDTPSAWPLATADASGHFTLRRQLVEIGVPVDRIPDDATHPYAAVEQLVAALPPAPESPRGAGEILVIAGPAQHAAAAAETLVCAPDSPYTEVWTYGCATGLGRRQPGTTERTLASVAHATKLADELRDSGQGPALLVVATDGPTWTGRPSELITATAPEALWAVVDATVKPGDARGVLAELGTVDAIAVANASRSGSPATAWDLSAPIALLDGRPSTSSSWAVLLLDKLSSLDRECSAAQC